MSNSKSFEMLYPAKQTQVGKRITKGYHLHTEPQKEQDQFDLPKQLVLQHNIYLLKSGKTADSNSMEETTPIKISGLK